VCLEVAPVVRRQSQPALEVRVKREVQSGGRDRPPFFRPLGDGFWPDVKGALPALAGVALDVLVFGDGDLAALLGATAGLSAVVIVRAVRRPRGAPRRPWSEHMSPTTPGAGFGQGTGPVAAQPRVVGRARARRSRIAGRARLSGVRFDERFERLRLGAGAHRSCSQ
jgi:hypothetical protein